MVLLPKSGDLNYCIHFDLEAPTIVQSELRVTHCDTTTVEQTMQNDSEGLLSIW